MTAMNLIENHETSETIERKQGEKRRNNKIQIIRRPNCEVNKCKNKRKEKENWTATSARCKICRKLERNNENLMENKQHNEQANNCETTTAGHISRLVHWSAENRPKILPTNGKRKCRWDTNDRASDGHEYSTAGMTLTQQCHCATDGRTRQQRRTASAIGKQIFDDFDCAGSHWVAICRLLLLMTQQTNVRRSKVVKGRTNKQTYKEINKCLIC